MKLHKLLLSLFAGAALFTGCQLEAPVSESNLAVDVKPSMLSFDGKTAGEAEVEVNAQASWTATVPADADWVTVTPASGGVGISKVKVAVLAGGEKARKAEIAFKAGNDTQLLTVEQSGGVKYGTKENPFTASKAYDWVAEKPGDAKTEEVYIKGIICSITAPYKADDYGNAHFYISDDGKNEGKVFQCYRCLYITPEGEKTGVKYSDPNARNISVGDEVLIYGKCVNYKGNTPETVQNEAWLISLKEGTSPVLAVATPAAEILADATEAKFAVEAKNVAKWTVAAKESYDWVTDFTKEGTTSGDITVTVKANTAAEARTAVFTVSADGVDPVELTLTQKGASVATTIAEITAQITSADKNNPSAYSANLTGAVVSYVNGGNAYIEDESGAILLYLSNHGLEPGKKISGVVKGTGYLYNGLPEITAIGSEAVIADGGTIPQTEMTIADLLANYAPNYSRRILLKGVTVKDAIADGDRNGVVTQNGAEINVYAGLNNKGLVLTEGATGDFICFPTVYINKNTGAVTNQLSFWDNSLFTAQGGGEPAKATIKDFAKEFVKVIDIWNATVGEIKMHSTVDATPNAHYIPDDTTIKVGDKTYNTADMYETASRSYLLLRGYDGLDTENYGAGKIAALAGGAQAMSTTEVPATHDYTWGSAPYNELGTYDIATGEGTSNNGHLIKIVDGKAVHSQVDVTILDNQVMRALNYSHGKDISNMCTYPRDPITNYAGSFSAKRALLTYAFFFKYMLDNNLDKADGIGADVVIRSELFGDENIPSGPVTIKTADEFIAWAADATADAELAADIDLTGKTLPEPVEATGSLDGNGKTITVSGLNRPVIPQIKGSVRNVTFAGSFAAADATAKLHLAPIGKSTGAIENVINKATVTYTGIAPEAAAGVTVAGIVCEAYGPVKNCKNQAKVSANGSGKDTWGLVVAGIVGFAGAAIEDCENSGEISLVAGSPLGRSTGMTEITMKYNPCPAVSGIVAYAVSDNSHAVSVSRCTNSGKVTMTYDNLTESSFGASRTGATGIVSAGGCPIAHCTNTGDIYFNAYGANRGVAIANPNIILHPAGIHGSDYYAKVLSSSASTIDQDETTITDCINSGNIYVDSDCVKSNSAVGGISGWPAAENAATVVSKISNCNNSGKITISGLLKVRVGGIAGGTSSIEGCKTTGDILVNNADAGSVVGLVNGFHTQGQTLKNCEGSGKIESKVKLLGVGGLCGGIGNAKNTFGENCKINAQLIGGATEQVGLVVGNLNGDTQAVTVGTETEPVLVKGSVNGVAITADNFSSYIHQASKYKEGIHVFNVKFDGAN